MDYILGPKPDGCIFCQALKGASEALAENLILHVAEHTYVIINKYPYTYAHIMVVPKRHVDRLEQLMPKERGENSRMLGLAAMVIGLVLSIYVYVAYNQNLPDSSASWSERLMVVEEDEWVS